MKTIATTLVLMLLSIASIAQNDTNFTESPITLETKTGTLYGTLCTPKKFSKIPVALIIAGSGPTDRDGNNPLGVKCDAYKILAHKLSEAGIASVRYDKRAIGESAPAGPKEADLRFDTYINDAKDWIEKLKADNRFSGVVVIGHSEGSLIGMNAAESGASKFISIAGAGKPAYDILKEQIAASPSTGLSKGLKDTLYMGIDTLEQGKLLVNFPPSLAMFFRASIQPYMISWFKHNPQQDIKRLTIPVLIIQGTNDLQIDSTDAALLKKADPKAKLAFIKGMNHVLREVGNDKQANMKSYGDPTIPLDADMVKDIIDFINKK